MSWVIRVCSKNSHIPIILQLETGRYAYVWVFRTDEFLDGKFDEVFGVSDLKNGNLYHVLPGEGGIRLEFVDKVLRPYTNSVK